MRALQVNEKNSFAGTAATGGAGASLVTPGSKVGPFCMVAAGLSRWKIWLFVHLAPPWQEAQLAARRLARAQRRRIARLRLMQRPHGGKDPQGLHVEGVTALRDAVVVDGRVRRRQVGRRGGILGVHCGPGSIPRSPPHWRSRSPLSSTGVVVEVGVAAANGAPVEQPLVFHVGELVEHAVQRLGLAWPRPEDPGDAIGQPVRMAGPAAAPGIS